MKCLLETSVVLTEFLKQLHLSQRLTWLTRSDLGGIQPVCTEVLGSKALIYLLLHFGRDST